MRVLVTGGAGFIGSHLTEALCRRGFQVAVLDNLSSGKRSNLSWAGPTDALEFFLGNVTDPSTLDRAIRGCDWVFHQAAVVSVPASVAQPLETHHTNLTGTLNLLMAARQAGVKRFVFASSSAVYGEHSDRAKAETLTPSPLSPYAVHKLAAEQYLRLFYQLYGLETVSLRYFNVFGPRQAFDSPYSGVIAKFCTALLAGQRPRIFGDGRQSRDFVYVDNVIAANLLAAEAPAERVAGRQFNVGGGQSVSLLELLAELQRLIGSTLAPEFAPSRPGDIRNSQADLTAVRAALGFEPRVTWQQGLEQTLDAYRRASAV